MTRREELLVSAGIPTNPLRAPAEGLSGVSSPEPRESGGGDLLLFAIAKEKREEEAAEESDKKVAQGELPGA